MLSDTSNSTLFSEQTPGLSALQLYPAVVVDNDDPSHNCRIKARVSQFFDGIKDADLPWAIPTLMHPDGASADSGISCVPKIGTTVLLHFQNGSPFHPIYSGYTVDNKTKLEEADHNYPNRAVIRFQSGMLVVIDTQSNELFLRNPGDLHALVVGNIDLTVMGNYTLRVDGDAEQTVNGNSIERVQGNLTDIVTGNRDELTAGQAQKFVRGNDGYYVSGTHVRTGAVISDNPSAGPPTPPSEPVQAQPYKWPGIMKGALPRALWRILHFW